MRELLRAEELLNEIYKTADPNNVNMKEDEKNKVIFIKSIEALENFESLRRQIKKLTRDYT